MNRLLLLALLGGMALGVVGCGPSKPMGIRYVGDIQEKRLDVERKQLELMERQTVALEKIAERCGR